MALTQAQRERIEMMRRAGVTYAGIADHLGLNPNTVKTWCRRAGITPDEEADQITDPCGVWCMHCAGRMTTQRPAKFCSEACRRAWWHAHPEALNRKAIYSFTCAHCGTAFQAYGNQRRKYCSHPCYIRHRFGTKGGRP